MWKALLAPKNRITAIRHGQASYLADDYDQLSPLGRRQAQLLGEFWVRREMEFDAVISGPARRHVDTASLTGEAFGRAGLPWPETVVFEEFDEFPGEGIVRILGPVLSDRYPHIKRLADQFEAAVLPDGKREVIDELFHDLCRRWVAAEVTSPQVETWVQFVNRITRGVERLCDLAARSPRIAVFTSAGPIAVATSLALQLSSKKTLELAFCSRNTSYSEFLLDRRKLLLCTFNTAPHLASAELLTYR